MTSEILELMKTKQQTMPSDSTICRMLRKDIRKKCKEAKDEWLSGKSTEIETLHKRDIAGMHKK